MSFDDVRAQLDRILESAPFARAERLSRFLRFVVDAAQRDGRESLKEYRIGVEVFDRGKDFDPRIDPIVRVQAAKLRSKLLEYYASAGAEDPLVITIPKGSYSADIRARKTPVVAAAVQPVVERSRIAVLPFVNMSADPENEHFSDGLTEELINRLASVPSLRVVARTSAFRFKGQNEDIRDVGAKLNVGTVMEGSVRKAGDQLRVTAQLIDVGSGYHLFSRTYQREYKNIFELQDELAQAVVDEIVPKRNGVGYLVAKTRTTTLDAYNVHLRGDVCAVESLRRSARVREIISRGAFDGARLCACVGRVGACVLDARLVLLDADAAGNASSEGGRVTHARARRSIGAGPQLARSFRMRIRMELAGGRNAIPARNRPSTRIGNHLSVLRCRGFAAPATLPGGMLDGRAGPVARSIQSTVPRDRCVCLRQRRTP